MDQVERLRLRVGCEFVLEADAPVPTLMLVRARPDEEHHTLYESKWLDPEVPLHEYVDVYGNRCWRFTIPQGGLTIRYDAVVETDREPDLVRPDVPLVPVEALPDETLIFTLPSRYVESDRLIGDAWQLFGNTPPTWARVQAICDWVHANVRYEAGSSGPATTALDVYRERRGVCRDFALISVALCRAVNIPARYTFGYFPDIDVEPPDVAMDFHAWFEAYLGDRWYTFDARHNHPRIGRVVIGRGRDAVDVALTTHFGSSRLKQMTVWSDEVLEGAGHPIGAIGAADVSADAALPTGVPAGPPAGRRRGRGGALARAEQPGASRPHPEWSRVRRVLFEVRQRYRYTYTQPVSDVRQRLVMVPPAWHGDQRVVSYSMDVRGARTGCEMSWESDRFGNRVCTVYAGQVEQALDFVATFRVERSRDGVAGGWGMPPNGPGADMLSETALTAADDRLRAIAAEIAGQTSSPRRRAELAAEWAAGAITYRIGVTGVQTPAAMALHLGQGVCQDYAHILLSVLRSMGVPGRYVSGQLPGEGVPHAWAEAILPLERGDGVEVVAYDPTHRRRAGIEYITVAVGRDFADVTPTSGYFSGPAGGRLSAEKRADVVDVDYQGAGAADEAAA